MDSKRHTAICLSAIAATALDMGVTPVKVTIVPCNSQLGFVSYEPKEPSHFASLDDFEARLELALAGHVAQQMFTDSVDTGFVNELMRAQRIAERMRDFGDSREPLDIVKAAIGRVRTKLAANERNVRRIADALIREETLEGSAFQQIIGGE